MAKAICSGYGFKPSRSSRSGELLLEHELPNLVQRLAAGDYFKARIVPILLPALEPRRDLLMAFGIDQQQGKREPSPRTAFTNLELPGLLLRRKLGILRPEEATALHRDPDVTVRRNRGQRALDRERLSYLRTPFRREDLALRRPLARDCPDQSLDSLLRKPAAQV